MNMHRFVILSALCLASAQASAVNKCTVNGKPVYQDTPCAIGAQSESLRLRTPSLNGDETWTFSRQVDTMSGLATCFASSPITHIFYGRGMSSTAQVYFQIAADKQSPSFRFSVRSIEGSASIFHHDLSGVGVKVDDRPMVYASKRLGQHGLAVRDEDQTALIASLIKGKEIRARLRFWPYDQTRDTNPVTLTGFGQASAAVMRCTS